MENTFSYFSHQTPELNTTTTYIFVASYWWRFSTLTMYIYWCRKKWKDFRRCIIEYTEFYKRLPSGLLSIPNVIETKNNLNFIFLGDEAFALSKHFLRPFPQQDLNYERRIFNYRLSRARNYRLSRARNVSENTFGLLNSRFRTLNTSINMAPEKVPCIVLAICALHNCLWKRSSTYVAPSTYDRDNATVTNAIQGDWRKEANNLENMQALRPRKVEADAVRNRNNYMAYFNNDGRVPWQDEMFKRGVV
jgi:hypothetical protein